MCHMCKGIPVTLQHCCFKWSAKAVWKIIFPEASRKDRKKRSPPAKVGDIFMTANHGRAIVLWKHDYKNMAIMFEDTLEIRENVLSHVAFSGKVSDPSVGNISIAAFNSYFYVGREFENDYGVYTIKQVVDSTSILIVWYDGAEQWTKADNIRRNNVAKDGPKLWNYLNVDVENHYVYYVKYFDKLVYVGSGKGSRYLHPNSGRSHNKDLNRIYFCGDLSGLCVSVPYQGLSKEQSESIERVIIWNIKPEFNSTICNPYQGLQDLCL